MGRPVDLVYLDSSAVIYFVEGKEPFFSKTKSICDVYRANAADMISSRLTRLECRVRPLRDRNSVVLQNYDEFFSEIELAELTPDVIERATRVRAVYNFATPDALHIATALELGAQVFVTGDAKLEALCNPSRRD